MQQIKFEIFVYVKESGGQFDSMYKRLDFWFSSVFMKSLNNTARMITIGLNNAA